LPCANRTTLVFEVDGRDGQRRRRRHTAPPRKNLAAL
jgi:hypothetical protein